MKIRTKNLLFVLFGLAATLIAYQVASSVNEVAAFQKTDSKELGSLYYMIFSVALIGLLVMYLVIRESGEIASAMEFLFGGIGRLVEKFTGKLIYFVFLLFIFLGAIYLLVKFIKWAWIS